MRPTEELLLKHPELVAPFSVEAAVLTADLTALTGAQYHLRPITPDFFQTLTEANFSQLSDIGNEPLIQKYFWIKGCLPVDIQKDFSFFRTCWQLGLYGAEAVIQNSAQEIRGCISLEISELGVNLMYWISDLNRGVMSQAICHIIDSIDKDIEIWAEINATNIRSEKLAARCGFRLCEPEVTHGLRYWTLSR